MSAPIPLSLVGLVGLGLLGACAGDGPEGDDAGSSSSSSSSTSSSSSSSSTSSSETSASGPHVAELLRAQVTIPAGTKVVEFDADAIGVAPDFATDGAAVTISVLDQSHPERDQAALCPTNHPLSGCATVDYGAFGDTHDNRLIVAGEGGPVALHLYKDRSVEAEAEALAPDE